MNGLHGVDLSSYNGIPREWKPQAGDIAWGAVKISELSAAGPYVNPDAAADWAALGAMGAGRVGYLFGHPAMSASATVGLFLDALRPLGIADGDMVALDLEVTDGLGPDAVAAWAGDVLRLLKRELDRIPLIYTFVAFAQEGNCAGLGGWPLWIAEPSAPPGRPFVPPPWRVHAVHQYEFGPPLDRDLANFLSLTAMRRALGKTAPKPPAPRRKDSAMLMNKGAGAITPFSVPAGAKNLVLTPADTAQVGVQTHDHGTQIVDLEWQPPGGKIVPIPGGVQFLHLHRVDDGTGDVSVGWE